MAALQPELQSTVPVLRAERDVDEGDHGRIRTDYLALSRIGYRREHAQSNELHGLHRELFYAYCPTGRYP